MQQISSNVYVETGYIGCNTGFVVTKEGVVVIDTPEKPSDAMKWRDKISDFGQVRYVVNTEPHGDHFSGNCFLGGIVVANEGTREAILNTSAQMFKENLKKNDPAGVEYLEEFYFRPPSITFSQNLTLYLGEHSIRLINVPGHSPYQVAVHIPEEGVLFTSDNVVYQLQPGLHQALPYEWLDSLQKIETLAANVLVPGHGDVCGPDYIPEMRAIIQDWIDAVTDAIQKGMNLEEAQNTISFAERYPMEEGHPLTMEEVQRENTERLYRVLKREP